MAHRHSQAGRRGPLGSASSPPTTTRSSSSIGAASRPRTEFEFAQRRRDRPSSTSRRARKGRARDPRQEGLTGGARAPSRRPARPPPPNGAGGPFRFRRRAGRLAIPGGSSLARCPPSAPPGAPATSCRTSGPCSTACSAIAASLAARYGYRPIETPLFEQAAVFERGIGEVTDVVEKELFRIAPRTEEAESWALRPEPTAGIVRAYVQHGMQTLPQPVKLTTTGPMFRYDRPQAGRYRQFWQFDVEAIGDPGPAVDAEIIELGPPVLHARSASPGSRSCVNSIGDPDCRPAYLAELVAYYRGHADVLPPTERDRLERNALRLLDSKDPAMAELNAAAPRITDRLCDACAAHFAAVKAHLDGARRAVPRRAGARPRPRLLHADGVRVLRRGPRGPAAGARRRRPLRRPGRAARRQADARASGSAWASTGSSLVLAEQGRVAAAADGPLAVVVGRGSGGHGRRACGSRPTCARRGSASAPTSRRRKLGRQLEAAGRTGAHFAVILGDELADGQVQLRDLLAGTQRVVAVEDLARELARAEQQPPARVADVRLHPRLPRRWHTIQTLEPPNRGRSAPMTALPSLATPYRTHTCGGAARRRRRDRRRSSPAGSIAVATTGS